MATTTNFGWETPDDTDLVKDGALAMRTLGNSIDSSFVDLKGGTTGQILSKASNTDLDYTWINNDQGDITGVTAGTGISGGGTSGTVTITNSMATEITAAGDIIVGTGSGTFDNLPIGTTGQVLTADTTVSPYKVKWASAGGGFPTFTGCYLYRTTSYSLPNQTFYSITWDAEQWDTDGFHSTSSNTSRVTVPTGKGGYYFFALAIQYASNSNSTRYAGIKKNGTTQYNSVTTASGVTGAVYGLSYGYIDLADGDYIEAEAYQQSGGNLNVEGSGITNSWFQVTKVA